MSVLVELNAPTYVKWMTLSRVPSIDEVVRVPATVNDRFKPLWFRVTKVVHAADTEEYPKRDRSLDAWVFCVPTEEAWK